MCLFMHKIYSYVLYSLSSFKSIKCCGIGIQKIEAVTYSFTGGFRKPNNSLVLSQVWTIVI